MWQTIDTAPLDGTHVILKVEGYAIEGWYDPKCKEWLSFHGCGRCGYDDEPPTHWMPLP